VTEFDRARGETIRYHEELYANTSLGDADSWLARPHRLIFEALALMPDDRAVVAYDLGCGIGRHTIPLLEKLPHGSEIHAIDLLDSAVEKLKQSAPASGATRLHARQGDLADVQLADGVDLVFAFSAMEHLPDPEAIARLLEKIASALRPGGVAAFGIVADRYEVDAAGERRPAFLESGITVQDAESLLADAFAGFEVIQERTHPASVVEERDGEEYTLSSTLLTWIGRRRTDGAPRRSESRGDEPRPLGEHVQVDR